MNVYALSPNSWLRECSEFLGDGFHHEITKHIEGLSSKLAVPFNPGEFTQRVVEDTRTHGLTFSELFSAFKDIVKERTGLSQTVAANDNVFSLEAAQQRRAAIETGGVNLNKISVDDLLKQYEKNAPAKPSAKVNTATLEQAAHSNIATKKPSTNTWGHSSTSQKVNAGMWGAGALLSAYSTLSAAKYSVTRDDQNKVHVQWSQVGVCLLQAAMAAGCAFMAVQAVNGRSSA